jgi:hypothetical protein
LVRCENGTEENLEAINRMKHYMQIIQGGGNEELALFPGETDTRAVEDNKRLKLCKMVPAKGFTGLA